MPKIICHLPNGNFLEWSTVVDAPTTYGMPRGEFDQYALQCYGSNYFENEHPIRMKRALENGTSSHPPIGVSFEKLAAHNRAGPNESCLSIDEIIARYGEIPAAQYQEDDEDCHFPDGYQILDTVTHKRWGHAENEILSWKLARQVMLSGMNSGASGR